VTIGIRTTDRSTRQRVSSWIGRSDGGMELDTAQVDGLRLDHLTPQTRQAPTPFAVSGSLLPIPRWTDSRERGFIANRTKKGPVPTLLLLPREQRRHSRDDDGVTVPDPCIEKFIEHGEAIGGEPTLGHIAPKEEDRDDRGGGGGAERLESR